MNLTSINGIIFLVNEKADIIGRKFVGKFNIGITGRQELIVNLILNYDCKSLKNDSLAKTICKIIDFVIYHVVIYKSH